MRYALLACSARHNEGPVDLSSRRRGFQDVGKRPL
jgi:hypothetical protein